MAKSTPKQLKVKLVRSLHGRRPTHRACIAGLGLRRLNHEILVQDTPENRGMIGKVSYLLQVEEA